jgi:hypothetical protein
MSNVLLYDLETGPNLAYVWGKYQQDVIQFESEWKLLSFSWKWLSGKTTQVCSLRDHTEEELVRELHILFDAADVIVAHNGDQFDQRMANAKFIQFGLNPPAPYKTVDTKKVAKRYFRFTSNKLDDIGAKLGLGRKLQTGGFGTWLGCLNDDRRAWAKMERYNIQDVKLLEKIYLKLRPWIDNHPPINVIDGKPDACPKCGSTRIQSRGTRINKTTTVQRFQCMACGGWLHARKSDKASVLYAN